MNEAVIETVQTLCREGNRDSVLTVFQNFPEHFSCIPLNDSNVESQQAINDLLREDVRKEANNNAERICPSVFVGCCQSSVSLGVVFHRLNRGTWERVVLRLALSAKPFFDSHRRT